MYRIKNDEEINPILKNTVVRFVSKTDEEDYIWDVEVLEEIEGFPTGSIITVYAEDLEKIEPVCNKN